MDDADVLRGVLAAYKTVMEASWPQLHPEMKERAAGWAAAGAERLNGELQEFMRASADHNVRVFWKLGTQFKFGGVNLGFARDAGFANPAAMVGLDDFDRRLPWTHQAAKYRQDDEEVFKTGQPKLDILERQQSKTGITWVRAGKAPIRKPNREVVGILGMYELLDAETGRKLFAERNLKRK